jgi:hypothetical protein
MEHPNGAKFEYSLALLANITRGCYGLPGANTLAYYKHSKTTGKSFYGRNLRRFFTDQPFQPSLIFVGKAGAYPIEELFRFSTLW